MANTSEAEPPADYPIVFRLDDMSISPAGHVLITGSEVEKARRLLLNYPRFYASSVVPFIRAREPGFQPSELWIDPQSRIHITNPRIARRIKRHLRRHGRV